MTDDVKIDSSNFSEYFFDTRTHRPQPGQIMAKFAAVAEFGPGREKRDIIKLLKLDKAHAASQVMKKIHSAKEPDCYRVPRQMAEDLLSGMSEEEVENKLYEFVLELFFYTKREHVPVNDPHWETIQLIQYDRESGTFKVSFDA